MTPSEHVHTECVLGARNETEIINLKDSDTLQWQVINSMRNRLPVWATLLITVISAIIAGLIVKITG